MLCYTKTTIIDSFHIVSAFISIQTDGKTHPLCITNREFIMQYDSEMTVVCIANQEFTMQYDSEMTVVCIANQEFTMCFIDF